MLLPKPNKVEFEKVPPGTFPARCYRFLDLGTQPKTHNNQTKLVHQVRLSWELPTELMTKGEHAGKPFSIHNSYTWSMHEKATLRNTLESWRGKKFSDADFGPDGFDTRKLIEAVCMIGVSHTEKDGKVYANISSVSPMIKGYEVPAPFNEPLYFSFDELAGLAPNVARPLLDQLFAKLSQGTRDMLARCPEYQKAIGNEHAEDEHNYPPIAVPEMSESIPF